MRLKTYTAPSMAEAMEMVRAELGEDAIIVSTQRGVGGQGVRITAAIEESQQVDDDIQQALGGSEGLPQSLSRVREALVYHGVPDRLIERLMMIARGLNDEGPVMACAASLDAAFSFAPLPEKSAKVPLILVGPPGSGKSLTLAKLAARAHLAGRRVKVISADAVRAGAIDQLRAFTSILQIHLFKARGAISLAKVLKEEKKDADLVLIDSPGLNPFSVPDMDYLKSLCECAEMEPILVLNAGGDPVESWDIARAFAEVGATRLLATRLDMTRRLGGIFAAAEAGKLKFCDVTINPHVADGLCPITPISLARLILPPDDAAELPPPPWADENEVTA
ncbi:MAG: GTP-binding protein [Rhodospirillaceae bacterium]|nr:GTP-binding protein [Rhodospirillaceae bacterium]